MRAAMMAVLLAAVAFPAAAKAPAKEAKVWAAAERLRPAQLQALDTTGVEITDHLVPGPADTPDLETVLYRVTRSR